MSEMIKLNIDGKDIEVEKGSSVLVAAKKANIDIVKKSEKEITNVDILRRLSQLEKYIYEKD